MNFVGYQLHNGRGLKGYYGNPFIFTSLGDSEFWVETVLEDEKYQVDRIHARCAGRCVWKMRPSGMKLGKQNEPPQSRVLVMNRAEENSGMLPIEVINADVLPSFLPDDELTIQVIALPLEISYYKTGEDFEKTIAPADDGQKYLIGEGGLLPISLLHNHGMNNPERDQEHDSDLYVTFRATVKQLYHGTFGVGEDKRNFFIRCIAETQFGDLEFEHTYEQVPEDLRDNIEVGATIFGVCLLAGDVAINEYDHGMIRDFDHDLRLLRYTFQEGEADRMRTVLHPDAVYRSCWREDTTDGAEAIIEKFKSIHENRESKYIAHLATIVGVDEPKDGDYPIGTRCIVLADKEPDHYESIAFIDVDEKGFITYLSTSNDSRYHFAIDRREEKDPLDDIEFPDHVATPMFMRAKLKGILPGDMAEEDLLTEDEWDETARSYAEEILNAWDLNASDEAYKNAMEHVMGYVFAKGVESTVSQRIHFDAENAKAGILASDMEESDLFRLEKAMEKGRMFARDVTVFLNMTQTGEEGFGDVLKDAVFAAWKIGRHYVKWRG